MLAVVILQVTVVTDTIIVGQLLGPVPMSGIRVASPIVNMLNVLSMLVGVGGATLVSIAMGKRQAGKANYMFSLTIALSIIFGAVFAVIVSPLAPVIASAISSDQSAVEYTSAFLQIVTAASPVYILASVMAILLRSDACIKLSGIVLSIAGVANVAFDLLFIGVLGLGVAGSALATDMGMLVAVLLSLLYFRWSKRTLKLVNPFKPLVSDGKNDTEPKTTFGAATVAVVKNGAASGLRMFLACVSLLFLNFIVGAQVGVMGIALMTICGNIQLLAVAFFSAGGQAATPMEGVLYGEKNFTGIRLLFKYVMKVTIIAVAVIIAIVCFFPGLLISLFCPDGLPIDGADWMLRLYSLGFLPLAVNYILTYYYNTVQQRTLSTTLTVCENLVIYLPLIWFLTTTMGLIGTILSFVVSELLSSMLAYAMARYTAVKKGFKDAMLLPDEQAAVVYEATAEITQPNAVALAKETRQALETHGASGGVSLRTSMAIEEAIVHGASRQGDGTIRFVDIRLIDTRDEFVLSLRDNADLFDPTSDALEDNEEFSSNAVLRSVASNIDYACVLGLNQTTIKIGKNIAAPNSGEDGEQKGENA